MHIRYKDQALGKREGECGGGAWKQTVEQLNLMEILRGCNREAAKRVENKSRCVYS